MLGRIAGGSAAVERIGMAAAFFVKQSPGESVD
jgi:hypothetical protein